MIKRTPQEIADFFGCYVFQGHDRDSFYMTKGKPGWNGADFTLHCDGMLSLIDKSVVDIPADHDWTHLYEPQKKDPIEVFKDIQSRKESAPHQIEVHVEKEYVLLGEFQPDTLMQKVDELLKEGFRLYGNPWTGPDSNYGYIHYQAMVRGV